MACHFLSEVNSMVTETFWTSHVKNDKWIRLSSLMMIICHRLVAKEQAGAVLLPYLLRVTVTVSGAFLSGAGGTRRPSLVNSEAQVQLL